MALTNVALKGAKPRAKEYKLADERGLYLLVTPAGGKHWRLKFRFAGKEKKLALGSYPEIGLKEARERRDEARRAIAAGIDPCAQKREAKAKLGAAGITFATVAEEYIAKMASEGLAPATVTKARWFQSLLTSGKPGETTLTLANKPVEEITPPMLLGALRVTEAKGNLESANRLRSFAGRVFRYAVATGRAERDISVDLRGTWFGQRPFTGPPSSIRKQFERFLSPSMATRAIRAPGSRFRFYRMCSCGPANCVSPSGRNSIWATRYGPFRRPGRRCARNTASRSPARS